VPDAAEIDREAGGLRATGFSIELTGSLTAAVNAELRVGALEETVTVTGETPIVDVQSVRRQPRFLKLSAQIDL
jgi:hypothetical protein